MLSTFDDCAPWLYDCPPWSTETPPSWLEDEDVAAWLEAQNVD